MSSSNDTWWLLTSGSKLDRDKGVNQVFLAKWPLAYFSYCYYYDWFPKSLIGFLDIT